MATYFLLYSRYSLATIFVLAAAPKIQRPRVFEQAIRDYRLVREGWVTSAARLTPALELATAGLLVTSAGLEYGAGLALVILIAFAIAVSINLARGSLIDCGCAGGIIAKPISWGLVCADLLLVSAAAFVLVAEVGGLPMREVGNVRALAPLIGTGILLGMSWHAAPGWLLVFRVPAAKVPRRTISVR
jgi:hypothetical protein